MKYLFIYILCLCIIYFFYIYYKFHKIWKNIEQNETELNYYRNKDNYDYINTNSGKINRGEKT